MVNYLPSQATTSITVTSLDIVTNLTINVSSPNVIQGQPFIVEGTLKRADTGANLAGENISLSYNGTSLGTVMTQDQEGSIKYQAIVQIDETGGFTLTADFAGSTRPGLTFLPSLARTGVILEGVTSYLPYLIPVAILAWLLLSKK